MKENQKAKLYLIPTPIGNFDDISIRVINVLKEVDIIFCEDTRTTSILLSKLNIKKKLIASHKYNESKNINKILKYLSENLVVGIVSDRGTPVISDPGYILTKNVIENGYEVVAIPGPTAFVPALIASGINPHHFLFYGFLDSKRSQRKKELENLKLERHTIIFYEAPHRLNETINDMKMILGNNRKVSICDDFDEETRIDSDVLSSNYFSYFQNSLSSCLSKSSVYELQNEIANNYCLTEEHRNKLKEESENLINLLDE